MCNCKSEVEANLAEHYARNIPGAKEHKIELTGYGLAIVNNTMELRPYMPLTATAKFPVKARPGEMREKRSKGTMSFNFCPFCGTPISTTS